MISLGTAAVAVIAVVAAATAIRGTSAPSSRQNQEQYLRHAARSSEPPDPFFEHAETTKLSSNNFNTSTSEGTWLVEYFLPTCPHCQQLAPIWAKLESDFRSFKYSRNFHFGQVNCADERALCKHIKGVPVLQIYRQRSLVKEYKGTNAYQEIADFINEESSSVANPFGTVLSLNNASFAELTQNGLWFVEFFAPWCSHCQQLAPAWELVGSRLKYKVNVAKVDCTVESYICQQHGIQGYPSIKMIQGSGSANYRGSRELEDLLAFAERVAASKVEWVTHEELPKIKDSKEVTFLFTIPDDTANDIKDIALSLAREFALNHKFLMTSDPKLVSEMKLPPNSSSLVVLKDGDVTRYQRSMRNPDRMRAWVRREKFPLLAKLNSDTAPDILDANLTLVLAVFPDDGSRTGSATPSLMEEIKHTARAYRDAMLNAMKKDAVDLDEEEEDEENATFAWIDGSKWAEYVFRVYGIRRGDMPAVVIARPQQDFYWDSGVDGKKIAFTKETIINALLDAQGGKLEPKSTIGFAAKAAKAMTLRFAHAGKYAGERPFVSAGAVTLSIGLCAFWCLRYVRSGTNRIDAAAEKAD